MANNDYPRGNLPGGQLPRHLQQATPSGAPSTGGGNKGGWLGSLIPVIGSVVGALIDKSSQDASNKANAQNVDKQIEFQREQNATAYQRAVADMRAAGLNPALGYKQGGADSGSGAAADNRPSITNSGLRLQQAVAAYNDFANGTAQRQLIREQAGLTYAQSRKTLMEGAILNPEAAAMLIPTNISEKQNAILAEIKARRFTADKASEQYYANLRRTNQGTATAKALEEESKTRATLNEQGFQNEWFRKNIAPYINSTAKTLEGVGAVARTGKGLTGYTPLHRYY